MVQRLTHGTLNPGIQVRLLVEENYFFTPIFKRGCYNFNFFFLYQNHIIQLMMSEDNISLLFSDDFLKLSIPEITIKFNEFEFNEDQTIDFFTKVLEFHSEIEVISLLYSLKLSNMNIDIIKRLFSLFHSPFFQTASLLLDSEQKSFDEVKDENKKLTNIVSQIEDPKTNLFKAAKEGILELAKNAIEKDPSIVNSTDDLVPFLYIFNQFVYT